MARFEGVGGIVATDPTYFYLALRDEAQECAFPDEIVSDFQATLSSKDENHRVGSEVSVFFLPSATDGSVELELRQPSHFQPDKINKITQKLVSIVQRHSHRLFILCLDVPVDGADPIFEQYRRHVKNGPLVLGKNS